MLFVENYIRVQFVKLLLYAGVLLLSICLLMVDVEYFIYEYFDMIVRSLLLQLHVDILYIRTRIRAAFTVCLFCNVYCYCSQVDTM